MIRILVVEDSLTVGTYLEWIFNQQPDMQVIGRVSNGKEAVSFVKRDKPDVITMDIEMPVMNGLQATREIMSSCPVPIVIVTASRNARETRMTMEALSAGALTLIEKPRGIKSEIGEKAREELITTTRLMAGVKVITRRAPSPLKTPLPPAINKDIKKISTDKAIKIVTVGVSTGGPAVLKEILGVLSPDFPYPIVIVQHIASGFMDGMVNWLSGVLEIKIKTGRDGEYLQSGTVYFAPDGRHMTVTRSGMIKLIDRGNDYICPSVSVLFRSVYECFGDQSLAIILTGMGSDGALEMKLLHDAGALTIAQHKASALIYGMPAEAVKLNAASLILHANEISALLKKIEDEFIRHDKIVS
ncbi:MAG: chemotaxis-specific protein-glutamate methyltransferase CheB [Candidatus Stygibacter frigidus]|nr:chemotaxis-specific protein-glutamate methyltransferase CheB [Candidatus Stygibacter frigidus]